jgi:hypothetical protein
MSFFPTRLRTAFHDVIRLVLNTLQIREGNNFFRQFEENGDGTIDFITFMHSGYAAESAGGPDMDSQICEYRLSFSQDAAIWILTLLLLFLKGVIRRPSRQNPGSLLMALQ